MFQLTQYFSYLSILTSGIPSLFDDIPFFGSGSLNDVGTVYEFPARQIAAANAIANNEFPPDFLFGVATSAYQIEGAWNTSDKTPSIWDDLTHQHPEFIDDHSNGDVAADSYHKYKEDLGLVENLGAKAYRISLSWLRILPNGFSNRISQSGVAYYNDLIDEMLKRGITPMVTIYHWDLPKRFQDMGGWANPLIADWFLDYARVVFDLFGDRVKLWITINEPQIMCIAGYAGDHAPRIQQPGIADYLCGHHVLLAHAKVYRLYDQAYRPIQNGKVGIVMSISRPVPEDPLSGEHAKAAERYFEFWNGWFLNPIFSTSGDYPAIMKSRIAINSALHGFQKSRLPLLTFENIEEVKNSADFLGVNFYVAHRVEPKFFDQSAVSFYNDAGVQLVKHKKKQFPELSTPWALEDVLYKIDDMYKIPMIYITENGYADQGQTVDVGRSKYYHQHIMAVLSSMKNGVDIRGYFAWSLLDNFEWIHGYTKHYGLYKVDFQDPKRTRTAKLSTKIIRDVYKTRKIPKLVQSLEEVPFIL